MAEDGISVGANLQDQITRNAQLDRRRDEVVRESNVVAREQEGRLASLPVGVDTYRASQELRRSETITSSSQVAPSHASTSYGFEVASIQDYATEYPEFAEEQLSQEPPVPLPSELPGDGQPVSEPSLAPSADGSMGADANLRYQKARLAATLEELERLRIVLADKSQAVAAAEAGVRDLQQKVTLVSRSERSLQAALEREKQSKEEMTRRSDTLERELLLLRKNEGEAVRREKNAGADQRSKDVRLNRALEELERTKAQLKQLKDEREGAGQGARAEAARLAAENARLRKRQSELILAFKKQAKLIDILKRQKLHVEAATLLSFTEEEFSKTLELGEALALA